MQYIIIVGIIIIFIVIKQMSLTKAEIINEVMKSEHILIDVRTKAEFLSNKIDNTINIPLNVLKTEILKQVKDKNANILVFCLSGSRSISGVNILKKAGYQNVYNLGSFNRAKSFVEKIKERNHIY